MQSLSSWELYSDYNFPCSWGHCLALLQTDAKRLLTFLVSARWVISSSALVSVFTWEQKVFYQGFWELSICVKPCLFKLPFLGVGIILYIRRDRSLSAWRVMAAVSADCDTHVIAAGITGAPGLNGYASKTLLHHAVSSLIEGGGYWAVWLERLFSLVGVGTAASFSKLYYLIFLARPAERNGDVRLERVGDKRFSGMQAGMILLVIVMLLIGISPELFLYKMAVPAVEAWGLNTELP